MFVDPVEKFNPLIPIPIRHFTCISVEDDGLFLEAYGDFRPSLCQETGIRFRRQCTTRNV